MIEKFSKVTRKNMWEKKYCNNLFLLLSCLFLTFNCYSQVAMKLELERKNFLQYENIFAKVIIRNISGHPLIFGDDQNWKGNLSFDIEFSYADKIPPIKKENPMLGKVIAPGAIETIIVPISEIYNLNKPGYYHVKAILSNSQLSANYQSNTIDFSVSDGIVVSKLSVGMPELFEANKKDNNKTRDYVIKSFFDGTDKVYCLIVEDDKYIYGVARIGYDIGSANPECEIDSLSRIHILVQNSPETFSYFVYDVNCNLDTKKVFIKTDTTPKIIRDPDTGKILVAGGKEQID